MYPFSSVTLFFRTEKRANRSSKCTSITSTDDYTSALEADSSDLEFYDLSDEEGTLLNGTTLDDVYEEIDRDLDSDIADVESVIVKLENLIKTYKEADLYWRLGRAYYLIATAQTDQTKKFAYIAKGKQFVDLALWEMLLFNMLIINSVI